MKTCIQVRGSLPRKKKKISFLLDIFLFTISISIKKSTKLAIFIRYFILRQQRVTRILDKISGKILLLLKKNSRENWRLEQPVPPSGNPSLGVSLACVSFRWDLRGVPDVSQRDLSAVYLFSPVFLSKEWREADTRVSIAILISHCDRRWNGSPAWMGRACVHASATHAASLSRNATPFCTRYTDTGLSLTGVRCTVDVVSMWNRTDCGHFKTKRRVQLSRLPLSGNQRRLAACRHRAEVKRVFWSWGWTRRRILVTPF